MHRQNPGEEQRLYDAPNKEFEAFFGAAKNADGSVDGAQVKHIAPIDSQVLGRDKIREAYSASFV